MDVYPFSARSSREGDRLGCQGLVLQTPGLLQEDSGQLSLIRWLGQLQRWVDGL